MREMGRRGSSRAGSSCLGERAPADSRLVHTRVPGDKVGLRGPVTTFAINPDDYDRIVMVSVRMGSVVPGGQ